MNKTLAFTVLVTGAAIAADANTAPASKKAKTTVAQRRQNGAHITASQQLRSQVTALSRTSARIRQNAVSDEVVARYASSRMGRDLALVLDTIEDVQQGGADSAGLELRGLAAVTRVLLAVQERAGTAVSAETADDVDGLFAESQYRRGAKKAETAIELEVSMAETIMQAITTDDGTIGPILKKGKRPVPAALATRFAGQPLEQVSWDRLSFDDRLLLLRSQSKGRDFFADRAIPGLKFKRQIKLRFGKSVALAGQQRTGLVDVSDTLLERVEFGGPTQVDDVSGLEIHIRKPGFATDTARDAFAVGAILETASERGHQHIVGKLKKLLARNPIARAMFVDFVRRLNTAGDADRLLAGKPLAPKVDGTITYFNYFTAGNLTMLNTQLERVSRGLGWGIRHDELKMGIFGVRTGDTYGDPDLIGLEYRDVQRTKQDGGKRALNRVAQKGLVTGFYGISKRAFAAWHERHIGPAPAEPTAPPKGLRGAWQRLTRWFSNTPKQHEQAMAAYVTKQSMALGAMHYNRPVNWTAINPELVAQIPTTLQGAFAAHADAALGLRMLVHDFSGDTALIGRPEAARQLRDAQITALKQWTQAMTVAPQEATKGLDRNAGLLKRFAQQSNIRDVFVDSLTGE